MSSRPTFEEFEQGSEAVGQLVDVARETVEDQKLKSFEDGYNAGWKDSLAAQTKASTFLSEHVAQALKEMKLTQKEAIEDALKTTLAAFSDLLKYFLPSLTSEHVQDIVWSIVEDTGVCSKEVPLSISTSNEDFQAVCAILNTGDPDIHIARSSHLGAGQIVISTGLETLEIDLREAGKAVLAELDTLMKTLREETGHV